jgi:hypothetical protein
MNRDITITYKEADLVSQLVDKETLKRIQEIAKMNDNEQKQFAQRALDTLFLFRDKLGITTTTIK